MLSVLTFKNKSDGLYGNLPQLAARSSLSCSSFASPLSLSRLTSFSSCFHVLTRFPTILSISLVGSFANSFVIVSSEVQSFTMLSAVIMGMMGVVSGQVVCAAQRKAAQHLVHSIAHSVIELFITAKLNCNLYLDSTGTTRPSFDSDDQVASLDDILVLVL